MIGSGGIRRCDAEHWETGKPRKADAYAWAGRGECDDASSGSTVACGNRAAGGEGAAQTSCRDGPRKVRSHLPSRSTSSAILISGSGPIRTYDHGNLYVWRFANRARARELQLIFRSGFRVAATQGL